MENKQEKALMRFSSETMLDNIELLRNIIQKIRQKEGGIGSQDDELALHRAIQDLDLLVDIADGLKASFDKLSQESQQLAATAVQIQQQKDGLQATYERMIKERNERIKELEEQLAKKKKRARKKPKA